MFFVSFLIHVEFKSENQGLKKKFNATQLFNNVRNIIFPGFIVKKVIVAENKY